MYCAIVACFGFGYGLVAESPACLIVSLILSYFIVFGSIPVEND